MDTSHQDPFPPGRGLIGVVHLPALPGAPRAALEPEAVYAAALADGRAYAEGGMDALIVENFGDVPFLPGAVEPHTPAFLAVAARLLRERTGLPVGINCLRNDGPAALGAAVAAGAGFVRVNVLAGAAVTDQGLVQGCAARLQRYRRELGAGGVRVLADILVKHAAPLGETDPERLALDTTRRALADALILTGPATGAPVDPALLEGLRRRQPRVPLLVGSGADEETVADLLRHADGVIVGSSLKEKGRVERPVDPDRVRAFVARASRG